MQVENGRALGSRYELIERLGGGAMGEVWRARDRVTGEEAAAKLLLSSYANDREIVTRFIQERSILMALDHPNIVRVHDLVVERDDLAIVMDLVRGPDLRSYLRTRGTLSVAEAVTIATAVLDALGAAHLQGCLHRDVKPDNVLIATTGRPTGADVRLSDFGIARLAQESTIQSTGLLGTPGYMPPELFSEGKFSAASDVYATGVLLYEMLSGRTPFSGSGTAHTVGFRHVTMQPPPLPVAPPLWHVVNTMLAKDPRQRLSVAGTAQALRDLPPEILAAPALPVQDPPLEWRAADQTSIAGREIQMHVAPAGLDVGATNLHSLPPDGDQPQPVAMKGQVQRYAPGGDVTGGVTQLGTAPPTYVPPVLTPGVVSAPERPRRRRWPWVLGALGVAGVTVGVLFATGVLGGGDGAPAPQPTAASTGPAVVQGGLSASDQGQVTEAGLLVIRSIDFDPSEHTATLTFSFSATSAPLEGTVLVDVPKFGSANDCADVGWTGDLQPTEVTNGGDSGIDGGCGWDVDLPSLRRGGEPVDVTGTVDVGDLGGDGAQQHLEDYLARIKSATDGDLADVTDGSDYALQRFTGVSVEVTNRNLATGQEVDVAVRGEFGDGQPVLIYTTSQTTVGAGLNSVLQQIGGKEPTLDYCSAVNRNGIAATTTDNCYVTATVGGSTSEETSFSIAGHDS